MAIITQFGLREFLRMKMRATPSSGIGQGVSSLDFIFAYLDDVSTVQSVDQGGCISLPAAPSCLPPIEKRAEVM
jgi:hypothetical protein